MRIFFLAAVTAWAAFAGGEEGRVDALFAKYTAAGSPGCAVGVLQRGATVLAKGYGLGDLEHGIALTPKTRFYMASVSKQFTSMSLLLAEQDGKLKLDDSIRKYVPELPAYAEGIPLRRLLDHTAGFRDYLSLWGMRGYSNESVLKEGASLALITRQKALNFPVGTAYSYSNSGYLLAAAALQKATGKALAAFAEERIYRPLEMQSSRFQFDHSEPIPNRAHGYRKQAGKWKTSDVGFDVIGSGGMYSNIEDMMKWARNYEKPVVGAGVLQALQTPGKLVDGQRTPGGYALGMIERDGTYSHSGGASGYSTFLLRVPKHGVTVVCLCNIGGAEVEKLAHATAAVYTGEPVAERAAASRERKATRAWREGEAFALAGEYWSEELQSVWKLEQRGDALWLVNEGEEEPVTPREDGAYGAGGYWLTAPAAAGGKVPGFTANVARALGVSFARR